MNIPLAPAAVPRPPEPQRPPLLRRRAPSCMHRSRRKRRRIASLMVLAMAMAGILGAAVPCGMAEAATGIVERISPTTMLERNHIAMNGEATLTVDDIVVTGAPKPLTDKTMLPVESGYHPEFVINLTNEYSSPGSISITANYRDIGIDPTTGESIGAIMKMDDFLMMPRGYTDTAMALLGMPWDNAAVHPGSTLPAYPQVRLSANFNGGYWMILASHARVEMTFYKNGDPNNVMDLSSSFITISSLDADTQNIPNPADGRTDGNEAIRPFPIYQKILLTEHSLVERWGDLFSYHGADIPSVVFTSNTERIDSYFYYGGNPAGTRPSNSDLAVTLYGVAEGRSFLFDVVDTQGWTHNMPYFGSIGSVEPPPPTKEAHAESPCAIGDAIQWRVTQYVPGRDEMLGSYTSVALADDIPEECRVTAIHLLREDGSEVTSGTKTEPGVNEVRYQFDLALESVYGHSYTLVIDTALESYPSDGSLTLSNQGLSDFNRSLVQRTNVVEVPLAQPRLSIGKSCDPATPFEPGDSVTYTLTVRNEAPGTIARQVVIEDAFDARQEAVAAIAEGSLELTDGQGNRLATANLSYLDDANGLHVGFTLPTGQDLRSQETLTVRYQAAFQTDNEGNPLGNVAKSWADNADEVLADCTLTPAEPSAPKEGTPRISLQKEVDSITAVRGSEVRYLLTARTEGPVKNLAVTDNLPDGLKLVEGSLQLWINGEFHAGDFAREGTGFIAKIGDVAAGTVVDISYAAIVENDAPFGDLINVATATGDEADPAEDAARTTIIDDFVPRVDGAFDNETPLARTGDEQGRWLAANALPLLAGAVALACVGSGGIWLCRRRRRP